ncbi:hypothetical protein BH20ACT9_BH20ACT9_17150 [soil metagenome]
MARSTAALSVSTYVEDRRRFDTLASRYPGGNRSEAFRHMLDLAERELLAQELARLQKIGDSAAAATGMGPGSLHERVTKFLDRCGGQPSEVAQQIVREETEGRISRRPSTRAERRNLAAELPPGG